MTNEATVITLLGNAGDPVEYTVAAGTAIPKGSIMEFSASPQTMIISTADNKFPVGITDTEKTATDGVTKIKVLTHAIIEVKLSAAGTRGLPQKLSGVNTVANADDNDITEAGEVLGMALETGTTGRINLLMNL